MERHAGFAVAIGISERMLQNLNRIYYHALRIDHRLSEENPPILMDLFLDVPRLELRAADNNRVRVSFTGWGPMRFRPPLTPEQRPIIFKASALVPLQLSFVKTVGLDGKFAMQLTLGLAGPQASLIELSVETYLGTFSPANQAFIDGPGFHSWAERLLQIRLGELGTQGPPISLDLLGDIVHHIEPSLSPTYRVLDGVLDVGINILDQHGAATFLGDPNLLIDFNQNNDIAIWINPFAVPFAVPIRAEVEAAIESHNATLENFSFSIGEGRFNIGGSASKTGGTVNFSAKAVPKLARPGVPAHQEELWFDMQDIHVDVDRDWWTVLLELVIARFTFGLGALLVEAFIDMVRNNVFAGIRHAPSDRAQRRVRQITLPLTIEPIVTFKLERFECHTEGLFTAMTITPQYRAAELTGGMSADLEQLARGGSVNYRVLLPFDYLPNDPNLIIDWSVRRMDTNQIVFQSSLLAKDSMSLSLTIASIPFMETERFTVECRVYRRFGATVIDVFHQSDKLNVTDRLKRTHPFVRWTHQAFVPSVRVETNGARTFLGRQIKVRRSKIHRTDLPARCLMASQYSLRRVFPPNPHADEFLHYLDELPFPRAKLRDHRAKVCDYCFFGGPTKNEPLIP